MRKILVILLSFTALDICCQVKSSYYQKAYDGIVAMLEGESAPSVKRAVFLAEWAYYEGDCQLVRGLQFPG